MGWGLLASIALLGGGLWYASRTALFSPRVDPEPAEAPAEAMPGPERAGLPTVGDQPGGDACLGLELLDVEPGTDGSPQGVWLRNRQAGPLLVRPGGQFQGFTLTRIATASSGHPSAKLWFASQPRPCELNLVRGIDLARALPTLPAQEKSTPDTLPPPAVAAHEQKERVLLHQIRIPALASKGYGARPAGGPRSAGQPSSAGLDAGLR